MFKNVMVGVDGEEGGHDAIALAKVLRDTAGELALAHVYQGERQAWRGSSPAYDLAEEERAQGLLEKAREEAGDDAQIRWRGAPTVGRGLHELAEDVKADLLVIGSSSRGLLHRVLVGDDIRAALNGAPCAVAVAPAGFGHHPVAVREIGVGYDGSPESEHALAVARTLAAVHNTRLSAFQAVLVGPHMIRSPPDGVRIEELVAEARDRLGALEGVEPHAAYGRPAEELALYGASLDLLVIGSRSYGPMGRLVHGSTAQELAHSARCPLLVLTRAARQREENEELGDTERAVVAKQ